MGTRHASRWRKPAVELSSTVGFRPRLALGYLGGGSVEF